MECGGLTPLCLGGLARPWACVTATEASFLRESGGKPPQSRSVALRIYELNDGPTLRLGRSLVPLGTNFDPASRWRTLGG